MSGWFYNYLYFIEILEVICTKDEILPEKGNIRTDIGKNRTDMRNIWTDMRRIRKVMSNIRKAIRKNPSEMVNKRPVKGNFRMPLGNIHPAKSNILLDTFQSRRMPAIHFFINVIHPPRLHYAFKPGFPILNIITSTWLAFAN
jgi:hypothetical protein